MKNICYYTPWLLLLCFFPHIHSMTEDGSEDFPPAEVAFEVYNDKTNTQKETKNVSGEFLTKRSKSAQGRVVWFRSCAEIEMDGQEDVVRKSDEERIAFAPLNCLLNDESIKRMNLSLYKAVIAHRMPDVHSSNSPFLHTYRVRLQGLTVADILVVMLESIESNLLNSIKTNEFVVDAKIQPPRAGVMMNNDSDSGTDTRKYPLHIASIIFVSVSFMILVLVSLTWLGFYYMQRYQISQYEYNGRRRHRITIKKAVDLIPTRTLKKGDPLVVTKRSCAICIETFSPSEHIRELLCKHCFHKTCVDPWLLSKHTCPLCKHNIVTSTPKNPQGVENHGVSVSDENLQTSSNPQQEGDSSSQEMNQLNQHPSAISSNEQQASPTTSSSNNQVSTTSNLSTINFIPTTPVATTATVDTSSSQV